MDLYLVGPEKPIIMKEITEINPSNVLLSYIEAKGAADKYKEAIKPKKLFIDSGAFTAWTKGKKLNVDEYIRWINGRDKYIDLYAQVDVIPGDIVKGATNQEVNEAAKTTWENYLYMWHALNDPDKLLYTFHVGEPYDYLKQALNWINPNGKHIPYIALGGMVNKGAPIRERFLDDCFKIIKQSNNPNVKVHAFGMTSLKLLESYPITSADSASWIISGANGDIATDFGTIGISDRFTNRLSHYSHLPKHLQNEIEKNLDEFGFTLEELRHSRDNRIIFNARYYNKKMANIKYNPKPRKKHLF